MGSAIVVVVGVTAPGDVAPGDPGAVVVVVGDVVVDEVDVVGAGCRRRTGAREVRVAAAAAAVPRDRGGGPGAGQHDGARSHYRGDAALAHATRTDLYGVPTGIVRDAAGERVECAARAARAIASSSGIEESSGVIADFQGSGERGPRRVEVVLHGALAELHRVGHFGNREIGEVEERECESLLGRERGHQGRELVVAIRPEAAVSGDVVAAMRCVSAF